MKFRKLNSIVRDVQWKFYIQRKEIYNGGIIIIITMENQQTRF